MDQKKLTYLFLGMGAVLAVLLIFNIIDPLISGLIFAVLLVVYGLTSNKLSGLK
jgi:hypothetical protein